MEDLEKWRKAGRIAADAREFGRLLIKKGTLLEEAAEKIDKKIVSLGGKTAFPTQISLNHVAAHYCPDLGEKTAFSDQVAKLDIGVHIDGCIGDAACTVDLSGESKALVESAEKALTEAIRAIKPGVMVKEIGEVIQQVITSYGFSPVRNLCGHGLDKFDVHAKPSIPNFNNGDSTRLEEGQVVAIEPFATTGSGIVIETSNPTVFRLVERKPVRDSTARQIVEEIEKFEGLPFAKRWLTQKFPAFKVNLALRELARLNALTEFPPLAEKERKNVSQAEDTVLVKEKPEVLTASL